MANEPVKKNPVLPATVAGTKTGAGNTAPSSPPVVAKPAFTPAPVAAAARESVALFGGHRGGGKKRADGLVAGSKEAVEADRKADAERKRLARAEKKIAALPPPLPSATATAQNPNQTPLNSSPDLPVAAGDLALPAVGVVFVPWTTRLLEKPAKLLGKIVDRWRSYSRAAQVKKLKLTPDAEKEILERMKWREDAVTDFSVALADCAAVELNKRRVPGAENSHWINLVMTGGELVSLELANTAMIEKLILEDKAKQAEAAKGTP